MALMSDIGIPKNKNVTDETGLPQGIDAKQSIDWRL